MPFLVPNTAQPIRAICFDLDGTLVETHIDFAAMKRTILEIASDHDVPTKPLKSLDILAAVRSLRYAVYDRDGEDAAQVLESFCFDKLEELEVDGCATPIIVPGAVEWTRALCAASIGVAVVTRNCRAVSSLLLDTFGIPYDVLLTRDDVQLTKPHPEHLWAALDALAVPYNESIMVGDHYMDVQAGQAAGCAATIGVLGARDGSWFDPIRPDIVVRDLSEAHGELGP